MSPSNSNNPSQVHLVFPASNDREVFQQAMPVQQSHISPMPIELERRMLQQAMPVQQSPFPAMPMQQPGIHVVRPAPIYLYNSPAFHMPTISQQAMPMQQWSMSPMPVQQAPWNTDYLGTAKRKLQDAPSSDQIQTFQQRAWSSKKFQIDLHEWVGEMKKKDWIDEKEERTLYHRIHQRDSGFIEMIIDIRDYAETMTDKALGLTWTSSDISPDTRTEIKNELLAKALQGLHFHLGYLKFSPEEWKALKVTELKNDRYIKIVDRQNRYRYFYNFKLADKESMKQMLKDACSRIKSTQGVTPETAGAADVKPFLSARLRFKRTSRKKSAHFLQVPCIMEEDIFNVQLVRYFVENVWKLERPDVIISVTGSADNFDLPPEHTAMLMRGMMEGTRKLQTWSVFIYGCISLVSVCGYCVVHA